MKNMNIISSTKTYKMVACAAMALAALPLHAAATLPDEAPSAAARAAAGDTIRYEAEAVQTGSWGNYTPFWLMSDEHGLAAAHKDFGYTRIAADGVMNRGRWTLRAGADVAAGWHLESPFSVQQLYAAARFWSVELTVGSRYYNAPFNDLELSSGDLLFSNNARPVPQVRLSVPDFLIVPGTRHMFALRGYCAYGLFTDADWQESFVRPTEIHSRHVRFHSKGLWVRVGNEERFPLTFEGGLEMAAQWGGEIIEGDKILYFPGGIKEAIKTFFFGGGDSSMPMGEQTNVAGNHVGEWSAQLKWQGEDWNVRAYYEHFFEDHSQLFFDYAWKDMLLGFEGTLPANPFVSRIVYEYLYTKHQSGAVYWDHTPELPEQVSGRDDYYNHGYYGGWQHWGFGLGNPLIISPIYSPGAIRFNCNRVIAHHFAFAGNPTAALSYRVMLSYTKGWGIYWDPFANIRTNFNALFELTYRPTRLRGFAISGAFAFDRGDLLGHSAGFRLSLSYTGLAFTSKRISK